jgi:hypothetical protein
MKERAIAGFDLTFRAPKSVSKTTGEVIVRERASGRVFALSSAPTGAGTS